MRTAQLTFVLLLALLTVGPQARSGDRGFAGTWRVEIERFGMHPQTCTGRLHLYQTSDGWRGTLRFDMILYARMHSLSEIDVQDDSITFVLEHAKFRLEFEGDLENEVFEGTCDWEGLGNYPFEAERVEPPKPFDEGLVFGPPFVKGNPFRLRVRPSRLARFVEEAEEAHTDALLVMKDGKLLCERYFRGKDEPIHLMSVTKFVAAMAVALLLDEGKIESLDAPLSTWFPEWGEGEKAKVTLRHVLAHTSGIAHGKTAKALNQAEDKVAYVRALELEDEPGTTFAYNNEAAALLTGVIRAAAGKPVDQYLKKRLFVPLGIEHWVWDRDGAGNPLTYAQLQMRARDVARIGLLLLNEGMWNDRQVFPKKAIELLSRPGSDLNEDCGLLWWLVREEGKTAGVYHTGYLGQWLVVLFDKKIVGVRLRRYDGSESPAHELGDFLSKLRALAK